MLKTSLLAMIAMLGLACISQAQTLYIYVDPSSGLIEYYGYVQGSGVEWNVQNRWINPYYFQAGKFSTVDVYNLDGSIHYGSFTCHDIFATTAGANQQAIPLTANAWNSADGATGGSVKALAYDPALMVLYLGGTFTTVGGNPNMQAFGIYESGVGWIQNYTLQVEYGVTGMSINNGVISFTGTYPYAYTGNWDFPGNDSFAGRYFNPPGEGLGWQVWPGYPITYGGYFTGGSGSLGPVQELPAYVIERFGPPAVDVTAPTPGAAFILQP